MTEVIITVALMIIFLALYTVIEFIINNLYRHCRPFRRRLKRFFESLPMWWS